MNGMEGIFGIIGIGAGLYSLYAWFQLKFKGIINTSILVPKDTNIKKCKDKEAFRAAAGPKLLVLAVVLILYGAEDLYNTYVQSTGMVCMDSQKAECKVFLKSDHKIKEKGRCRQKELHLLISFGGKICYNKSIAWQRKCDGDKRKCHARDEMPEDSDPFQDGTVLKEAFDRLNKYVVG